MTDRATFVGFISAATFVSDGKPFHLASPSQQAGMLPLIDAFEALYGAGGDLRWLAYTLGTAVRETGATMQPIREWGQGHGMPYGVPTQDGGQVAYGRGYVQCTWAANYHKVDGLLGLGGALVQNYDLMLTPDVAAKTAFRGMEVGIFTGRKFANFFTTSGADWVNARTMINAHDHANDIAAAAQTFLSALLAANGQAS